MDPTVFFSSPANAQISILLSLSALADDEKRLWLKILPLMNDLEKGELIENLKEDVAELAQYEAAALSKMQYMLAIQQQSGIQDFFPV